MFDLREEQEQNTWDSTHINSESVSDGIDISNLQDERHFAQRI
jgi:hypothetical protein